MDATLLNYHSLDTPDTSLESRPKEDKRDH